MILIVLAIFWVALLTPIAIRHYRDGRSEKSIASFHAEHEVLKRQDYSVAPAHRLDEEEPVEPLVRSGRPRLTVVHPGDTYQSLETRVSWQEWSERYDYDREDDVVRRPTNRYAAAYSSVPTVAETTARREPSVRRRTMKAQRRFVFTWLTVSVLASTALALFLSSSYLIDLAVAAWVAFASYLAVALFALSQGYLLESSLGLRSRVPARVQPIYSAYDDDHEAAQGEFYEAEPSVQWQREATSRYALG